jgi:hypothetical protein
MDIIKKWLTAYGKVVAWMEKVNSKISKGWHHRPFGTF